MACCLFYIGGGENIRKRNIIVGLRFTAEELQELSLKASRAGLLRGEFVRRAIHGAQLKEAPPADYTELIRQLKNVGSMLDSLIKAAYVGSPDEKELRAALAYNSEVEHRVWDAFASNV